MKLDSGTSRIELNEFATRKNLGEDLYVSRDSKIYTTGEKIAEGFKLGTEL